MVIFSLQVQAKPDSIKVCRDGGREGGKEGGREGRGKGGRGGGDEEGGVMLNSPAVSNTCTSQNNGFCPVTSENIQIHHMHRTISLGDLVQ